MRVCCDRFDVDGELACAGAEEMAADTDVVAEVEEFVECEGVFAGIVFADVDLEALAALLELREAGFARTRMAMMRPAMETLMGEGADSSCSAVRES